MAAATTTAVRRCAAQYSIEVTPGAARKIANFGDIAGLRTGTSVNVTYLVGADIDESIDTCERLVQGGMRPVAHVPARAFASLGDAEGYLRALRGVGVEEALVLAGGAPAPVGALTESMQLLESGLFAKHGFAKLGVAAHPEGHPDISAAALDEALLRKASWAAAEGTELYFATQFCFEPQPIAAWEERTRVALRGALGAETRLPRVRLGVAGPAKVSSLIKFGAMSGVGASLNFFKKYSGNVFKLASRAAPDDVVAGVAAHMAATNSASEDGAGECLLEGLHFYPFGGFLSTLRWANAVEAGDFEMSADGLKFEVANKV